MSLYFTTCNGTYFVRRALDGGVVVCQCVGEELPNCESDVEIGFFCCPLPLRYVNQSGVGAPRQAWISASSSNTITRSAAMPMCSCNWVVSKVSSSSCWKAIVSWGN